MEQTPAKDCTFLVEDADKFLYLVQTELLVPYELLLTAEQTNYSYSTGIEKKIKNIKRQTHK